MSDISDYKVIPESVERVKLPQDSVDGIDGGEGCLIYGVFVVIFFVIVVGFVSVLRTDPQAPEITILVLGLPFLPLWMISNAIRNKRLKEKEEQLLRVKNLEEVKKAESLSSELQKLLKESIDLKETLPKYLNEVSVTVMQCHVEYKDNAFDPFWTKIEKTAIILNNFRLDTQSLSRNAKLYYTKLKGRVHNFPMFPIDLNSLPDPEAILEEFKSTVRLGQTNFQFATIWEQRKTRQVLIAGFNTLGDAVNNLGTATRNGFLAMQESFRSEIAGLAAEVSITRVVIEQHAEEQNEMLDNIQRGRKPIF